MDGGHSAWPLHSAKSTVSLEAACKEVLVCQDYLRYDDPLGFGTHGATVVA